MKGLTTQQFKEVQEFVQKYHAFADISADRSEFPKMDKYGFSIKYIDSCYDTRQRDVWSVKFRGYYNICFNTNQFGILNPKPKYFKYDNLFDWIMDWLKGEWTNNNIITTMLIKPD